MPALQFSAAMLSNLLNGSQPEGTPKGAEGAGKKPGTDQFSSLLDVVGNISEPGTAQNNPKKDDDKTPVAAAIDVPAPFKNNTHDDDDKKPVRVDNDNKPDAAKPAARAKDDSDDGSRKTSSKNDADDDAPVQKTSDPKILKSDKNADVSDNDKIAASDDTEELKAKISDRVDSLADLMNIIAQLLAGAGNVTAQTDITISVNATGDNVAASAATNAVSDPFAVFDDLKNTLAKLQQFLQGANAQDAPLSEAQSLTLTAINNALQADLDALKGLLPQTADGDKQPSIVSLLQETQSTQTTAVTESTAQTAATGDDVKSLLQSDISLIKDALQKFKNASMPENLKKNGAQVQLPAQPVITDALNNDKAPAPQDSKQPTPTIAAITLIPVAEQQAAQPQTQNNQPQLAVAAAVQNPASGGDADANAGGNSGQGGGNSQPQITIGGLSATQSGATDKAAGSQFSGLLHRATQTPVAEQVAFQIKTAVNTGNSKISIQLHPEDLGKLDITLDVDAKGKTGVTITADNKQTLDMLQRDYQGLQKALADAGLKTDAGSLSFNLRGGEREGQGSQNQSQAASQYQKSQPDEQLDEINIAQVAAVTRSYTINLPDGLDIKI